MRVFFALLVCSAVAWGCSDSGESSGEPRDGGSTDAPDPEASSDATAGGGSGGRTGSGGRPGSGGRSGSGGSAALDAGSGGVAPDGGQAGAATNDAAADATPDAAVSVGPYPEGPYGGELGDTFPNLALRGYVNDTAVGLANLQPWVDRYTMEDARATGAPYALVHVSAFYCPGCRHAATDLGLQGKSVVDAGGKVLEILSVQSRAPTPATVDGLNAWIESYDVVVSSFIDAEDAPLASIRLASIRETVYILEMPSMKVVYLDHGDTTGRTPSSIGPAVTEILRLLE